jgi:hypothetical protein
MEAFLFLHAWWRWLALAVGAFVTLKALVGGLGRRPWGKLDERLGLAYTIIVDLQTFSGLVIWLLGPIGLRNLAQAMGNSGLRFLALEHPLLMLIALALAHIGRSRIRKAQTDAIRHRTAFIFYSLSALFVALIFLMPRS